jgi:lipopolysaccharide/colanic/teichoic acid biosynthesis glycosyltransferase
MAGDARGARSLRPWFARSGDFLAACALIILFLPLMIVVALAIKCDSRGPVLRWELRVNPGGHRFWALKFRSTVHELDSAAYRTPQATFVGDIIRTLRLDTLPQLLNVLRGEMTCLPAEPDHLFFLD